MKCGVSWVLLDSDIIATVELHEVWCKLGLLDSVIIATVELHEVWCKLGVVRLSYHSYSGAP